MFFQVMVCLVQLQITIRKSEKTDKRFVNNKKGYADKEQVNEKVKS